MGSIHEIKKIKKSCDTAPLSHFPNLSEFHGSREQSVDTSALLAVQRKTEKYLREDGKIFPRDLSWDNPNLLAILA